MEAPLPERETDRLAALRALRILDTEPDERFDRLAAFACNIFRVPIALVSLVDENRQWFKSCVGLDLAETDRSMSFCAHAVTADRMLVIEDAFADERFADNPLVTGPPGIRFYAGAILHAPDTTLALGTLCVIDCVPRAFSAYDRSILAELATLVEEQFAITEERRGLRQYEAVLRAATGHCILATDDAGSITIFNSGAERLLGWRADEVVGKPLLEFLHPDDLSKAAAFLDRQRDRTGEGEGDPLHMRFVRDGEVRDAEAVAYTLVDDPSIRGIVLTIRDITEQRQLERLKSQFISAVSHELRTPLTSIKGSLGLIVGGVAGELPEQAAHLVKVADRNSDLLMQLVDDILDLDRLDDGRMILERDDEPLDAIVGRSVDAVSGMAAQRNVRIVTHGVDATVIHVDGFRISQALTNLLGNAVKFSPEGADVTVTVGHAPDAMTLQVSDAGPGIPADMREAIFERFEQVRGANSLSGEGTGLGLPIARGIVEAHGYSLSVESAEGNGSRFTIRLPLGDE